MDKGTHQTVRGQAGIEEGSALEGMLREGARRMLQAAIEGEVAEYVNAHSEIVGRDGRRLVVRNGHLPERELLTGIGAVADSPAMTSRASRSAQA